MKTMLERGAGILMPVSSLPSPYGIGTFGSAAYDFVDFLKKARQKYWQVLPVGPTSYGDSPYQSFSALAGNPYFIDLDTLVKEGLLTQDEINACYWGDNPTQVAYDAVFWYRFPLLKKAHARSEYREEQGYEKFCMDSWFWLNDYAFYMALKFHFDNKEWLAWPEDIRFRKKEAVESYREELKDEIDFWKFFQYKFYQQWGKLRAYANEQGISIIGDIPIYVALDSADVWTHPELFLLDEETEKPFKECAEWAFPGSYPLKVACQDSLLEGFVFRLRPDGYGPFRRHGGVSPFPDYIQLPADADDGTGTPPDTYFVDVVEEHVFVNAGRAYLGIRQYFREELLYCQLGLGIGNLGVFRDFDDANCPLRSISGNSSH